MKECSHFERCAACTLPFSTISQENWASLQEAKQLLGNDFRLQKGALTGVRRRVKLTVRGNLGQLKVGIFEGRSHQILEIPHCLAHHPQINQWAQKIADFFNASGMSAYDEKTRLGQIRYLQLTLDSSHARCQIVVVVNEDSITLRNQLRDFYLKEKESGLNAIWVNLNARSDNVIFTKNFEKVEGEPWLWDVFSNRKIAVHPGGFVQANAEMFQKLLNRLGNFVPSNAVLADLYAGSGVIGLSLEGKAKKIYFNDISEESYASFLASEKPSFEWEYTVGGASDRLPCFEDKALNLVIVDPPRKGLEPSLMNRLIDTQTIQRILYISCGWESFKRDQNQLMALGFKRTHVEGFLFFPGTEHLEIFAVFDREERA